MNIKYGAKVVDIDGKVLGTVDALMRNTWTGEVSKFVVNRKHTTKDLFLSPEDVFEATEAEVKLNLSIGEPKRNN